MRLVVKAVTKLGELEGRRRGERSERPPEPEGRIGRDPAGARKVSLSLVALQLRSINTKCHLN
ncbi:MAG TPA: hypothetical protein DEA61_07710 [Caldanaerobacter subterraneus]|uniref:Uncharacterized protein n=1 Tax=Caldanaerobacter subterraneus TaxID=911092 RepID=A0A357VNA4_9THEO|nr:hypothetical protein [Caldanaerobacter subterraneus]